jgi:branched-subunit amino acid aminotransferase/4-amino-4-deoxychorismate lyase
MAQSPPPRSLWLTNGRLLGDAEVRISPWDRGFRFGDGIYETLRLHRGTVIRLAEHLARMREGLEILALDLDPVAAFPASELDRLVQALDLTAGEGRVRLFVTRGVDRGAATPARNPTPTCLATIEPLPPGTPASLPGPLRLRTVEAAAPRPAAWAGLKSLNHLPYVLAALAAERAGADEALLVYEGRVKETTAANLFLVFGDALVTPARSEGLLAGVTRDWVLELARANGLTVAERPVTSAECERATELFVTGSVAGIRAVTELDGRPQGAGPGPVTQRLQAIYADALAAAARIGQGGGS